MTVKLDDIVTINSDEEKWLYRVSTIDLFTGEIRLVGIWLTTFKDDELKVVNLVPGTTKLLLNGMVEEVTYDHMPSPHEIVACFDNGNSVWDNVHRFRLADVTKDNEEDFVKKERAFRCKVRSVKIDDDFNHETPKDKLITVADVIYALSQVPQDAISLCNFSFKFVHDSFSTVGEADDIPVLSTAVPGSSAKAFIAAVKKYTDWTHSSLMGDPVSDCKCEVDYIGGHMPDCKERTKKR